MSLLEDIFLQDEANEARELEKVIEGGDYDERPRSLSPSGDESDNDRREDEAEEDKRRVDPSSTKTRKVTKNPRFILNPARLTGPRGIQVIPEHFKDFKFKGKGHEKEDLDMVLKKLEHWAYRLYPKFQFEDCLKKIETLGKKRPVMVHLHKIRTDQLISEETVNQKDSSDEEAAPHQEEDEFDKLLQQQIDLARTTPALGSVKKAVNNDQWERLLETPKDTRSSFTMPKATSSPSISDEQKERMLRNRKLAEERRLARLKEAASNVAIITNTAVQIDVEMNTDKQNGSNMNSEMIPRKINRSNVISSSDSEDECNIITVNQSVQVDIHSNIHDSKPDNDETTEVDLRRNTDVESMPIEDGESTESRDIVDIEVTKTNEENIVKTTSNDDGNDYHVNNTSNSVIVVCEKTQIINKADPEVEIMNVDIADVKITNSDDKLRNEIANEMITKSNCNRNNSGEITDNSEHNQGNYTTNRSNNNDEEINITETADEGATNKRETIESTGNRQHNEILVNKDTSETIEFDDKIINVEDAADKYVEDLMDVDFSDDF